MLNIFFFTLIIKFHDEIFLARKSSSRGFEIGTVLEVVHS